jgi:hypothetical protein
MKGEDYAVSEESGKTKLTWVGSFAEGGIEAIESGDSVFCTYSTFEASMPSEGGEPTPTPEPEPEPEPTPELVPFMLPVWFVQAGQDVHFQGSLDDFNKILVGEIANVDFGSNLDAIGNPQIGIKQATVESKGPHTVPGIGPEYFIVRFEFANPEEDNQIEQLMSGGIYPVNVEFFVEAEEPTPEPEPEPTPEPTPEPELVPFVLPINTLDFNNFGDIYFVGTSEDLDKIVVGRNANLSLQGLGVTSLPVLSKELATMEGYFIVRFDLSFDNLPDFPSDVEFFVDAE